MPITIKSTGMKYKNPDTGVYQGVDMLEEATIRDVIVDVYSPTLPYAVGEYCLYNGELYCCTTAIPSGGETWNSAHWDKTNVTDELEDIKGAVDSIGSDDVANESNVSGTTVSDALDTLDGAIGAIGSDDVANESNVTGATVSDALDNLSGAINGRINRGAVDISVLTDIWLVTAKDGVYMVTGSSRIGTFVEDADHNFGILTLATAPQTSFDYGYIAFHSTTGRTFYRDFTRANDNISWRTALQKIAIGSEISNLSGAVNDKVSKSGDTMTGALQSQTAYVSNGSYSSNQWATEIYFKDANNVNIGQFRTGHMANGDEIVEFFGRRNVSGSDVFNALKLGIKPDGTKYIEFNNSADASIWRTAIGLAEEGRYSKDTDIAIQTAPSSDTAILDLDTGFYQLNLSATTTYLPERYGVLEIIKAHNYGIARVTKVNANDLKVYYRTFNASSKTWYNSTWIQM